MSKKILVIRSCAIGDVVHTTVIQQSIKEKYPDCEVHFLTSDLMAPLLSNDPNLKKVFEFNSEKKGGLSSLIKLGLELRKEKFDIIINLQNTIRNKVVTSIANPKKIIYRSKNRIHAIDAFFNSAKEIFNDIERPKNLKLYLKESTLNSIETKIKDYPRPFIVISPGGEHNNNRQGRVWPISYWTELSNMLIEKHGGTVFIVGSKAERETHKELLKTNSCVLFSGKLTIEESACLFSKADLFISGDSGPLHMASALDIKTLGIMGSTPASACGPYGEKCYSITPNYECSPCGKKLCDKSQNDTYTPCMRSITPQIVFDFIEDNNLLN